MQSATDFSILIAAVALPHLTHVWALILIATVVTPGFADQTVRAALPWIPEGRVTGQLVAVDERAGVRFPADLCERNVEACKRSIPMTLMATLGNKFIVEVMRHLPDGSTRVERREVLSSDAHFAAWTAPPRDLREFLLW